MPMIERKRTNEEGVRAENNQQSERNQDEKRRKEEEDHPKLPFFLAATGLLDLKNRADLLKRPRTWMSVIKRPRRMRNKLKKS